MPEQSSLDNWISTVDGEPGFFQDVFKAMKMFAEEDKHCILLVDAMAIRKQKIFDKSKNKFIGFCDYGPHILCNDKEQAKEALVFMLNSLNGKWRWPIGYVLQNKTPASVLAQLISTSIRLSVGAGLYVYGLTCDGAKTNLAAMRKLGCIIDGEFESLNPVFQVEGIDKDFYFVPDACHNLKLARNLIADYGVLIDRDGGLIEWRYIVKLQEIQEAIRLKIANKLSRRHIEWGKNKMKVKYAGQVMSLSVADALQYLKDIGRIQRLRSHY